MSLSTNKIFKIIEDVRYADIIVSYEEQAYSLKVTSFLNRDSLNIEFHVPKRCLEVNKALQNEQPILLKYSTEYVEISSEWHNDAPKDKRISTIVGIEIHLRASAQPLNEESLVQHLYKTQNQNLERIHDKFTIDQLDKKYFIDTLSEINGFSIKISKENIKTVENLISYRSNSDKLKTIEKLTKLAQEKPSNKFSYAAELIEID